MAFESKLDIEEKESKKDFNGIPPCNCGRQSVIAIAGVINVNTGEYKSGAASQFCGRTKENNSNYILQPRYSKQSFDGYCAECWSNLPKTGRRTYSDDLVRTAWMWFIGYMAKDSESMAGIFSSDKEYTVDQKEEFLMVVNHEAKRCNQPDAIPDEYKIAEVWRIEQMKKLREEVGI